VPKRTIGQDWEAVLRWRTDPAAVFLPDDWANWVLPQIAAFRAINLAESTLSGNDPEFGRVGWRQGDYSGVGLPLSKLRYLSRG
jgi:hypothetical protein